MIGNLASFKAKPAVQINITVVPWTCEKEFTATGGTLFFGVWWRWPSAGRLVSSGVPDPFFRFVFVVVSGCILAVLNGIVSVVREKRPERRHGQ